MVGLGVQSPLGKRQFSHETLREQILSVSQFLAVLPFLIFESVHSETRHLWLARPPGSPHAPFIKMASCQADKGRGSDMEAQNVRFNLNPSNWTLTKETAAAMFFGR